MRWEDGSRGEGERKLEERRRGERRRRDWEGKCSPIFAITNFIGFEHNSILLNKRSLLLTLFKAICDYDYEKCVSKSIQYTNVQCVPFTAMSWKPMYSTSFSFIRRGSLVLTPLL